MNVFLTCCLWKNNLFTEMIKKLENTQKKYKIIKKAIICMILMMK